MISFHGGHSSESLLVQSSTSICYWHVRQIRSRISEFSLIIQFLFSLYWCPVASHVRFYSDAHPQGQKLTILNLPEDISHTLLSTNFQFMSLD